MQKAKFVLSKSKVIEQYEKIKQMSDVVSYSSKTNQEITKILEKETDSLFSVHFETELKHVKDLSRVIFLAQAWNETKIRNLMSKGITKFIVDNESDLDQLLNLKDIKVEMLLLRTKLKENSIRTEKYFVFGMNYETINKRIKELKNKANKIGIHFHRKTQNMSEWNLQYEIENMFSDDTLNLIDFINIGGGIPTVYANTNVKVFDSIFKKIKEFHSWLKNKNIKMIIEPGRFIAAPSIELHTKIIGIDEKNIVVNASVYNSDLDALVVPVKLLIKNEKENGIPYVIKGFTPCSLDLFRYKVYLNNPQIGDSIIFLNAGAYNFHSDFCDLEKIETEVIE